LFEVYPFFLITDEELHPTKNYIRPSHVPNAHFPATAPMRSGGPTEERPATAIDLARCS
jgi:hypothetical protein